MSKEMTGAEMVIEAEVFPDRVDQEGPYGEYPGYRSGEMGNALPAVSLGAGRRLDRRSSARA